MRTNSTWYGPICAAPLSGSISTSSAERISPCSSSLDLISPSVSRVAQTSGTSISRMRYGSAPTWSSCPWVSTTARTSCTVLAEVLEVGQHEVDAEMLVAWERQPGVDDDDAAVGFDHGQVLADLAQAAERDDSRALGHSQSVFSPFPAAFLLG